MLQYKIHSNSVHLITQWDKTPKGLIVKLALNYCHIYARVLPSASWPNHLPLMNTLSYLNNNFFEVVALLFYLI